MAGFIDTGKQLTGIGGGIDITMIITIFALIIVFGILAGGVTWWLVSRKQWKYSIVVFEKVNGRPIPNRKDKAKLLRIGHTGDEVLLLKKHKKILPMPNLQTGINTYWYEIRDDGEWINIEPKSIDENNGGMEMHYLDKEMRYARGSLSYVNKERYDEVSFLQKYGGLIAYGVLILVTAIGMWLIIDQLIDVAAANASAMKTAEGVLEESKRILGLIDNIRGGSGIKTA